MLQIMKIIVLLKIGNETKKSPDLECMTLKFHTMNYLHLQPQLFNTSVAPEPRLGSVLARAFGQKARLGSLSFSKSSGLKYSANTSFLKNFEKDHWQSTVLMGKIPSFLSTMAF